MGTRWKWEASTRSALQSLYDDVGQGNYRSYAVESFPAGLVAPGLERKLTQFGVIISGSVAEQRDWMAIIPYRPDVSPLRAPYDYQFDKDPMLFYFGTDGMPSSSGLVTFHADYEGRNQGIYETNYSSVEEAVSDLRAKYEEVWGSIDDSPTDWVNALGFAAGLFRRHEK